MYLIPPVGNVVKLATPLAGGQKLTPNTSTALTVPDGARGAVISVETQNVRVRFDGTAPDATTGVLLLPSNGPFVVDSPAMLAGALFINAVAGGIINVQYFK